MIQMQIGFLLGMITGGMCVLLGWLFGTIFKRRKPIRTPSPLRIADHWNCGVCGCSHKYYEGAIRCHHGRRFI